MVNLTRRIEVSKKITSGDNPLSISQLCSCGGWRPISNYPIAIKRGKFDNFCYSDDLLLSDGSNIFLGFFIIYDQESGKKNKQPRIEWYVYSPEYDEDKLLLDWQGETINNIFVYSKNNIKHWQELPNLPRRKDDPFTVWQDAIKNPPTIIFKSESEDDEDDEYGNCASSGPLLVLDGQNRFHISVKVDQSGESYWCTADYLLASDSGNLDTYDFCDDYAYIKIKPVFWTYLPSLPVSEKGKSRTVKKKRR